MTVSTMAIGKLERVDLRKVWKHEALDFTRWLTDNIDVLAEELGITLVDAEREKAAGDFNVDIIAEDGNGGTVVIENQLGPSDHDHLGKLITYLTAMNAKTAIWIVPEARQEHIRAVAWLNESTAATFYLLEVEAVKIGDSPPAPLLHKIVGPSEAAREAGKTKKELAERHINRRRFWEGLLAHAREKTKLFANISPGTENWISTGAGRSGLSFNYVVSMYNVRVELYIDRGRDEDGQNIAIFNQLMQSRPIIEQLFGGELIWDPIEGRRACRISAEINIGGLRDEEQWPQIHKEAVGAMIRLENALKPYIAKLEI